MCNWPTEKHPFLPPYADFMVRPIDFAGVMWKISVEGRIDLLAFLCFG